MIGVEVYEVYQVLKENTLTAPKTAVNLRREGEVKSIVAAAAAALLLGTPARGWWGDGHGILTRAAFKALPEGVPAFFCQGGEVAANVVFDADLFKNRGVPRAYNAEHPEHYFDVELLQGRQPPSTRYAFLEMCAGAGLDPSSVGLAPYAVAEWTERLMVAFAEHRRWPQNEAIQSKCLVYAGFVAHYAEDLCQPLHVTVHYDGRVQADGGSPHSGIHKRVDALVEKLEFKPEDLARGLEITAADSLMPAILETIDQSHALVDLVYKLEGELGDAWTPQVREFAWERARAAARFTAVLYLSAWEKSAAVKLPDWLERK